MSKRFIYTAGFIVILLLLGTSIGLQIFDGIMPCPLCTLQRISFGLIGIFFFIGIFVYRSRIATQLINFLSLIASCLGGFFAGRQVWLQYFPTGDSSECGVSLQYMMQALPLSEVAQKIFSGSAECSQRGFEFLWLNMAEWALVWFVLFFFTSFYLLVKKR